MVFCRGFCSLGSSRRRRAAQATWQRVPGSFCASGEYRYRVIIYSARHPRLRGATWISRRSAGQRENRRPPSLSLPSQDQRGTKVLCRRRSAHAQHNSSSLSCRLVALGQPAKLLRFAARARTAQHTRGRAVVGVHRERSSPRSGKISLFPPRLPVSAPGPGRRPFPTSSDQFAQLPPRMKLIDWFTSPFAICRAWMFEALSGNPMLESWSS